MSGPVSPFPTLAAESADACHTAAGSEPKGPRLELAMLKAAGFLAMKSGAAGAHDRDSPCVATVLGQRPVASGTEIPCRGRSIHSPLDDERPAAESATGRSSCTQDSAAEAQERAAGRSDSEDRQQSLLPMSPHACSNVAQLATRPPISRTARVRVYKHRGDPGDGDLVGLGAQRRQVLVGVLAAPTLQQLLAGTSGDDHPDSSTLVEDPVGHQLVQSLGCGGGVDAAIYRRSGRRPRSCTTAGLGLISTADAPP
jgi:hypothetical protein